MIFADCNRQVLHETWRQTSLPPLRRRLAPRDFAAGGDSPDPRLGGAPRRSFAFGQSSERRTKGRQSSAASFTASQLGSAGPAWPEQPTRSDSRIPARAPQRQVAEGNVAFEVTYDLV